MMKSIALRFGLITGLIVIAFSAIVSYSYGDLSQVSIEDLEAMENWGYLRYLFLTVGVILAIRYFRNKTGKFGLKNLFLTGLLTALMIAILVGLMEAVYMMMNPDFMDQYTRLSMEQLRRGGGSEDELKLKEAQMQQFSWLAHPALMGLFYLVETALIGTIVSVITSLILRKKVSAAEQ